MEVLMIISVITGLTIVLVVGNVLIYRCIVSRVLKKIVRPHFMCLGYKV